MLFPLSRTHSQQQNRLNAIGEPFAVFVQAVVRVVVVVVVVT